MIIPLFFQYLLIGAMATSCSSGNRNCDDPNAENYSSRARTDMECVYSESRITPTLLTDLPKKIKETSGLALINNELYTHNDRGHDNILYTFSPENGAVTAKITLSNGTNEDWEDLAQSETHLFVGDMGNNNGDRTDLKIYMVEKENLQGSGDRSVVHSGVITFNYPEQTIFWLDDHNFDCEAIIYRNGYLFLFTKHRTDDRTNLYRIPAEPGDYPAEKLASFPAGGRITGADISQSGQKVVLCGYKKSGDVFLWVLSNFGNDHFFSGDKHRIVLGRFSAIGQVEALVFKDTSNLYISSEKTKEHGLPARLYSLRLP